MQPIAIYGTGGVAREVAATLKLFPDWELIGFFDDFAPKGPNILGGLAELNEWPIELNIVLAFSNPQGKKRLRSQLTNPLLHFPNIIHPSAVLLDKETLTLGQGNIIHPQCMLSCNVSLGDFNFLNYAVTVGHDVKMGHFNALMPMVNISGNVTVGNETFWGLKSAIAQQLRAGDRCKVGAGAILLDNAENDSFYVSIPARKK